ncbi:MAG: LysM peptidoglycan-binding domain-containing protein [Saprospiraceae bacterium]|nr:LysM peptidoglycan-binding domain-containing protein [Saprospiraceae bacterium]
MTRFSRYLLTLLWGLMLCTQAVAKEQTTTLLGPKDTLQLSIVNGKKFALHPVKAGHTLFSIAKYYALGLDELFELNPQLAKDPTLRIGTRIRISLPNKAIKRYKNAKFGKGPHVPIYYIVQPGDNLYQICKRNFDMEVDTIIKRNRLKNNEIKPGQALLVAWMGAEGIDPAWRTPVAKSGDTAIKSRFDKAEKKGAAEHAQGVCFWQKDSKEKGDPYALHRNARPGSIIEIINPMGGRRVYARVIGTIPDGYEKNVEVVLSPDAARKLGAKDPRFFVKVRYFK